MTNNLERRLIEHRTLNKNSYTSKRKPLKLVWHQSFTSPKEAIKIEKQIKGWSKNKKKALINNEWKDLVKFSKNYTQYGKPSSTSSD